MSELAKHRNLASERVRIGMSQTKLAEVLGTSLKSVSNYELDKCPMPPDFVNAAADLFGCSTDYLYDRTDDRLPREAAVAD